MEVAQQANKKVKTTNRGTWSMSFADVVKEKIIAVIYQNDEGGKIPRNQ